jgi:hypothetical protein
MTSTILRSAAAMPPITITLKAEQQMKATTLAITLAAFCFIANADTYYTYNPSTGGLSAVQGSANEVHPTQWQIWLYASGVPHSFVKGLQWGIIGGKTIESVTKQLKDGQKVKLDFNKFSGMKETRFTYFNPLGPIAIFESSPLPKTKEYQEATQRLEGLDVRLHDIYDAYENAKGLAEGNEYKVGSVFKEYMDNLKDAWKLKAKLRSSLDDALGIGTSRLDEDFADLQKDVDVLKRSAENLNKPSTSILRIERNNFGGDETTLFYTGRSQGEVKAEVKSALFHLGSIAWQGEFTKDGGMLMVLMVGDANISVRIGKGWVKMELRNPSSPDPSVI